MVRRAKKGREAFLQEEVRDAQDRRSRHPHAGDEHFTVTAGFPVTGGRAIDLSAGHLTGTVNGTSTRVPVFTLDLSKAGIGVTGSTVTSTNAGLVLTDTAAGALNQTLGTSLVPGGLRSGSARSTVQLRK
jgi:hypothetical protein